MMKRTTICGLLAMTALLSAQVMAMGNRQPDSSPGSSVVSTANSLGNNDAAQQATGDIGAAVAKGGQALVNQGYEAANQGATNANSQGIINNGVKVFTYGKAVEYTGKAAPHVGWVATSAGYAAEGQYKGAAVQAVNGVTRTVTVAKIGAAAATAGGIWVSGKLGALAGSAAGPLGTLGGFIIGCGAAYVGGKIWDNTVGAGADALTQKTADWDAQSQYAGDTQDGRSSGGGGGSGWGDDNARDGARDATTQQVRDNMPRPRPPTGGGGGGDCGRH